MAADQMLYVIWIIFLGFVIYMGWYCYQAYKSYEYDKENGLIDDDWRRDSADLSAYDLRKCLNVTADSTDLGAYALMQYNDEDREE